MIVALAELEGKNYPLVFSINAAERIEEELVPVDEILQLLREPRKYNRNEICAIKDLSYLLIQEGIEYCVIKNKTEQKERKIEFELPEKKNFFTTISYEGYVNLVSAVIECMSLSSEKKVVNKAGKNDEITDQIYLCMAVWARMMGMSPEEFMHLPVGELSDNIEMYQRVKGIAKADVINEGEYVPNLR